MISQHGEIVGRLNVEISRISGSIEVPIKQNTSSSKMDESLYDEYEDDDSDSDGKTITVKVTVRHLAGITSSHYVFCQ